MQGHKSRGREERKEGSKEGKRLGRKTALFGQAARESLGAVRYGKVTFPLSGGMRSHGTCLPKKEGSQLPKITGFQLSVILIFLCLLMVFQTNKTHPAWQAQPSLHRPPVPARPG